MNCIVTAGPTCEPLDRVRRLTNFSTGQLGTELANYLSDRGHCVTLLKGHYAVYRGTVRAKEVISFTTTEDLETRLKALAAPAVGALFHAAAVSDFRFGQVFRRGNAAELEPVHAGKFPTTQTNLLVELIPTSKIIEKLRGWFSAAQIVGWKYEVDGNRDTALNAGREQIQRCRTDACVVNGPAYGAGFGLVAGDGRYSHQADAPALYRSLTEVLLSGNAAEPSVSRREDF